MVTTNDAATTGAVWGNSQGHVDSGGATIARDSTASGSQAVVDGQNSYWEVHGDLVMGGRGVFGGILATRFCHHP